MNTQNTPKQPKSQAELYYKQGVDARKEGKIGQALQYFEKAIKLDPQYADLYLQYAIAKFTLNLQADTLPYYNKAIELAPQEPIYYIYRANEYHALGRDKEAIADYEKYMDLLIAQQQELPEIEMQIGADPEEADYPCGFLPNEVILAKLEKAVEKYPNNAYYWGLRADVYADMGEKEKATAGWKKYIELCIEQGLPFYPYIAGWERAGFTRSQLLEYCERAIQKWPGNKEYQKLKDRLLSNSDFQRDIINSVRKALSKPISTLAEQDIAALDEREKAVKIDPNSAENYYNRAQSYAADKQMAKAISDLETTILLGQNTVFMYKAYEVLPQAYEKNGQYEKAIQTVIRYLHQKYKDMQNHTEYVPFNEGTSWTKEIVYNDVPYLIRLCIQARKTEKEMNDLFPAGTFGHKIGKIAEFLKYEKSEPDIFRRDIFHIASDYSFCPEKPLEEVRKWLTRFVETNKYDQ